MSSQSIEAMTCWKAHKKHPRQYIRPRINTLPHFWDTVDAIEAGEDVPAERSFIASVWNLYSSCLFHDSSSQPG